MKDGKILLTVCMESSVGLPNAEKGTTMENSIQSIAQYYTASVNPDVTFEFVTLTADQEERSNRIDQLQTEMMAGQGPDIFILPCDDGFGFNETRLIENVEKGMVTGLFADLSQLYDQDETLEKDLLLEKVMDAGMMDGKRYILPLRYQYPIILALEDELQGAGLEISELAQNSETFLSTVIAQEGNAWHVSGANVFAANLSNVFPSLLLLDAFGLLNTYWALLLPLAFAPLGTFLLTQIFRSVPADILQAARLDGAGTLQVMVKVLLPCGKSGVSTLIILTLIESWNMVEQPLIYLKDVGSYPLSVFLASRYTENLPLQFVCCVLSLLPLALCFFYCSGDVLDSGIPKEEKA